MLLAEEAAALGWDTSPTEIRFTADAASSLLEQPASSDLASVARQRLLMQAIERIANSARRIDRRICP